jgi:CheY-like chemotaxis protein
MASILVIDDDQTTRALIGVAVEELGHVATYAHDGNEGVEIIKGASYDVVFMDMAMPNKNGLVAIQEILAEYPATKIVAVSGVAPDMLERALEFGAMETMSKPITPEEVQDTVERLLHGRPTKGWDEITSD